MTYKFEIGDVVKCINSRQIRPFKGAGWVLDRIFTIQRITLNSTGNILWPGEDESGIFENEVELLKETNWKRRLTQ